MLRTLPVFLSIIVFALSGICLAQDEAQTKPQEEKAYENFAEIKARFDSDLAEFEKAYMAIEDQLERAQYVHKHLPQIPDYGDDVLELVAKNPASPDSANALAWLSRTPIPKYQQPAIELLLKHHVTWKGMADVVGNFARGYPLHSNEKAILEVIRKTPHEDVKAKATFAQLKFYELLHQRLADESWLPRVAEQFDPSVMEYFESRDLKELNTRTISLMKEILETWPDVSIMGSPTFGEQITSRLFEMENLQVGMKVPAIEGEDLDGVSFKLSDYEGKVVMLTFWGHW